ncbi:phosphoribosylformylglycinamidine cyclo-ligase [Alkalicoccobacillus gibsonii]|jgi:phosphoribosylformylglycinamidine cyclo-ligase|uniref:phosphoribosylformylglycinamidine cyclo-ligase n=1 Tax=Alkalicoccobacillus gibsonii TaxID=79881 RepID=UPI0019336968|nr:phosphoribosylformylglycinamidine cyclo-ligase [Alkalicoccobacillus gibsonii]MBM0067548.1 phosphoribosylformylglycinamidine cyclo-ligase [Alkalicoccobacillus gibsonii]
MSDAYKQAGVDIEAGYESVKRMGQHVKRTARAGVLGGLGGFGGNFDLSSLNYKEPVLVSGTDGVGTKLMLAFMMDKHDTIGVDAVAMCVNDIVVQGAEPLYFLDYIACGKADPARIEAIVKGVADGCEQAGCALIGGETAEMPGMYDPEEYDLAGFSVGAVEKSALITGDAIKPGNVVIGLSSSGLHSNGFSLVRHILLEKSGYALTDQVDGLEDSLGEVLLTPTKIYVKPLLAAIKHHTVNGLAHITGGGFYENVPRMLPAGTKVEIDNGSWPIPAIFNVLKREGELSEKDLFSTFNMGIGMMLVVPEEEHLDVIRTLEAEGEQAYIIGRVTEGEGVAIGGIDS